MSSKINVESIKVGMLYTNCYKIEIGNEVLIVDPADEYERIEMLVGDKKLAGIIITHYHFDHIGALEELKEHYKCRVYDIHNLREGENEISNFKFEVLYVPGHKEDEIAIYFKNDGIMFTGDFIFKRTIGRFDLEGGSFEDMKGSIKKILSYPNTLLYPGHGSHTYLDEEREMLGEYLNMKVEE